MVVAAVGLVLGSGDCSGSVAWYCKMGVGVSKWGWGCEEGGVAGYLCALMHSGVVMCSWAVVC